MNEKFSSVREFVRENLVNDWRPFVLNLSGGGKVRFSSFNDLLLLVFLLFYCLS